MQTAHFDTASDAKHNIKTIVDAYKRQHPDEYGQLKKAVQFHREALKDEKFASAKAGGGSDMRALYEISETLQMAFAMNLTVDQTVWFKTVQGGRWFAKTFGEFALPSSV